MTIVSEYAEAVLRRARQPMEPKDWDTDWHDKPWRHKVYPGVHSLPLPAGLDAGLAPLGEALLGHSTQARPPVSDMDMLGGLLRNSYGLLGRRLRVTGNNDNDQRYWSQNATWARGTASGGGLYPVEIYWVAGPSSSVLPGVYHYFSPHHTMERLLAGDATGTVRDALPEAGPAGGYLLATIKFWKNSFKYNSFTYHVVTMDLGALLGTWSLWGAATATPLVPHLWFHDKPVNDLLGIDGVTESTFAIVPLREGSGCGSNGTRGSVGRAAVRHTEWERSQQVHRFSMVESVHEQTLLDSAATPPDVTGLGATVPAPRGAPIPLPPPDFARLDEGVGPVLRRRRSSFGAFVGEPALSTDDLSLVLAAGARAARLPMDFRPGGEAPFTRLCVYVNHVATVKPGVYDYDPDSDALYPIITAPIGTLLQQSYFLDNYNLEQAAAVIAVMGKPVEVIKAAGERAYRAVNAEVGTVTQAVYLTATGQSLGCGAVLGFDNTTLAEMADAAGSGEWPLIIIMIGKERGDDADVDTQLA